MATSPVPSPPAAADRAAALAEDFAYLAVLLSAVALAAAILVLAFAL